MLKPFLAIVAVALTLPALAQKGEGPMENSPPKGHTPDEIIKIVASKEREFQQARERYIYRQDTHVEEFDGHTVVGEYKIIEEVTFDDRGRRQENVLLAPQNTLTRVSMMKEDEDDFRNIFSFVITPEELPVYDVKYLGHQQVDELGTYVFEIDPVRPEKHRRYFKGRIWVDDQDLLIVKSSGIGYPNSKENQPVPFTTWREQIDGKYWFPTYTSGQADICAMDKHGTCMDSGTPIQVKVKYTDYRQYKATTKVTFGDVVDDQPNQQQQQPPPKNPK